MKHGFKHFLTGCIAVVVGVLFIDFCFGKIMDKALTQISRQGQIGKTQYSLYEVNVPILVVGSSRAAHHYIPTILEEYFNEPVYNVGVDGCFYSYNTCAINSILDRYIPKLIIWENNQNALYDSTPDTFKSLYPYYGKNKWVTDVIKEKEKFDINLLLRSSLFRYNSIVLRLGLRYLTKSSYVEDTTFGFEPLVPKKNNIGLTLSDEQIIHGEINSSNVEQFRNLIERAKSLGTKIIMVDSPRYYAGNDDDGQSEKIMKDILEKNGMYYIDNTCLKVFLDHPEYFNDYTHLNTVGAECYTKLFISQLEKIGVK